MPTDIGIADVIRDYRGNDVISRESRHASETLNDREALPLRGETCYACQTRVRINELNDRLGKLGGGGGRGGGGEGGEGEGTK